MAFKGQSPYSCQSVELLLWTQPSLTTAAYLPTQCATAILSMRCVPAFKLRKTPGHVDRWSELTRPVPGGNTTFCRGPSAHLKYRGAQALPLVAEHFYCIALKSTSAIARSSLAACGLLYCIDRELVSLKPLLHRSLCLSGQNVAFESWPYLSVHVFLQTYEPFYEDFGPLNLGQAYRFCCRTTSLRQVSSTCLAQSVLSESAALPISLD